MLIRRELNKKFDELVENWLKTVHGSTIFSDLEIGSLHFKKSYQKSIPIKFIFPLNYKNFNNSLHISILSGKNLTKAKKRSQ